LQQKAVLRKPQLLHKLDTLRYQAGQSNLSWRKGLGRRGLSAHLVEAAALRTLNVCWIMKKSFFVIGLALSCTFLIAARPKVGVKGDYLEVRSCDIFTGACIANSEMGLTGKEGMMVWAIRQGDWRGTKLDNLNVVAVVHTQDTLGDLRYQRHSGRAVLLVDDRASAQEREALVEFAKSMGGPLLSDVVAIKSLPIDVKLGQCSSGSCAQVKAGDDVEISTRCLGGKDHLCGNEENYYPPLTSVDHAFSVFTELATFKAPDLNLTWELAGKRSAYIATFSAR
jgi:hypothetical protein